jgi:flagellar biosynthesis protein FlhA
LLSRQDADAYLDRVREQNPKLIEDLTPKLMPLSLIQRVLQNLLRERVSIRDALTVLEALAEGGVATKNPTLLTEFVRQSISRTLVKPYLNEKGELPAFLLDAGLERQIQSGVEHTEQSSRLTLAPEIIREALDKTRAKIGVLHAPTALLCGTPVRFAMRQILETDLPLLATLSHAEIPPHIQIVSLGTVK